MPKYYTEGETPTRNVGDPRPYFEWYLNNPQMNNPEEFVKRYRELQAAGDSQRNIFYSELRRSEWSDLFSLILQPKSEIDESREEIFEDLRNIWNARMQSILDPETATSTSSPAAIKFAKYIEKFPLDNYVITHVGVGDQDLYRMSMGQFIFTGTLAATKDAMFRATLLWAFREEPRTPQTYPTFYEGLRTPPFNLELTKRDREELQKMFFDNAIFEVKREIPEAPPEQPSQTPSSGVSKAKVAGSGFLGGLIGAGIGALIGFVLGGPPGAAIGAAAGAAMGVGWGIYFGSRPSYPGENVELSKTQSENTYEEDIEDSSWDKGLKPSSLAKPEAGPDRAPEAITPQRDAQVTQTQQEPAQKGPETPAPKTPEQSGRKLK